jgi:LacI family transcriptional regulator
MKNTKTTIADIAEALGISAISVSRALSGQTGVSEDLRNKIIDKAKEMGYIKLKNSDDANILVLHQKPFIQDNSNFSYMVQGIEKSLQKTGAEYSVEFVDKENQEQLYLPYRLSKGHVFDGVIFIGRFQQKYVEFLRERIKSQVFYTGYSPSYDYDSVWFNFNNGGYKQCEYLIKNGHEKIGFIGSIRKFKNKEKLIGITSALEDYELPVINDFFLDVEEDFDEKVLELISGEDKPTAIICQWDFTAVRLIKILYEKGLKVPGDISIIGSGNSEMAALTIPALTTLNHNIEYACEAAVALLLKRINNPSKPYENITVNSTLVERSSVKRLK